MMIPSFRACLEQVNTVLGREQTCERLPGATAVPSTAEIFGSKPSRHKRTRHIGDGTVRSSEINPYRNAVSLMDLEAVILDGAYRSNGIAEPVRGGPSSSGSPRSPSPTCSPRRGRRERVTGSGWRRRKPPATMDASGIVCSALARRERTSREQPQGA